MRHVNMLDLHGEFQLFADEIHAAIDGVLDGQQFINGPAVSELERALAQRVGAAHAIAVSNGSDALLVALMALEIGAGDEVIVPSFTFFATAGTVARLQAKPVFVDIDPETFNMDPAGVEAAVSAKTKAIIPVHLFGQCANMDAINAIARRHGLKVIEDAAQAIGATYGGRQAGTLADVACLSFYPTKNLGGFGEGGMVLTDDDGVAKIVRQLRSHGESQKYVHDRVGGNFRLDTLKAAILLVKLRYLEEFTRRRRANASHYDKLLASAPVTTPYRAPQCAHVYHQYSIMCDRRDDLMAHLKDRGVASAVYYPIPLHLQRCFANLGYKPGSLPATERTCGRVLSIPCHPMLIADDLHDVASCVHDFYDRGLRSGDRMGTDTQDRSRIPARRDGSVR